MSAGGVLVALETSSRRPSVAARAGERVGARRLDGARPHASDLLPALESLLAELDARPADVAGVLVGTGPGSYTGLRVGAATALGLARATGAAARGVPSGETLVWERLAPGGEACLLLDARGGLVYLAHYRRAAQDVDVLRAPCALACADAAGQVPRGVPILGDATVADAAGLDADQRARLVADAVPDARALLELGARRLERLGAQPLTEIEPLYLRAFCARPRKR